MSGTARKRPCFEQARSKVRTIRSRDVSEEFSSQHETRDEEAFQSPDGAKEVQRRGCFGWCFATQSMFQSPDGAKEVQRWKGPWGFGPRTREFQSPDGAKEVQLYPDGEVWPVEDIGFNPLTGLKRCNQGDGPYARTGGGGGFNPLTGLKRCNLLAMLEATGSQWPCFNPLTGLKRCNEWRVEWRFNNEKVVSIP